MLRKIYTALALSLCFIFPVKNQLSCFSDVYDLNAKKVQQYIETNDSAGLNFFLQKMDAYTKKKLLATKVIVKDVQACEFLIDFLNLAVSYEYYKIAAVLLKHGADSNVCGCDGFSPLTRAVEKNLPYMIELLGAFGVDINACDKNSSTALFGATKKSYTDLILLLLKLGANVNDQDSEGNTVLHNAIEQSDDNLALLFIEHGADVNALNSINTSPLHMAASCGKKSIVQACLKDKEPSLNDFVKLMDKNDIDAFMLLLQHCKTSPFTNDSLFLYALELGDKNFIDTFCKKSKNFTQGTIFGHSPLNLAVMHGHVELVKYLVEQCHANMDQSDCDGFTPLHCAALYGNYELTDYFIKKKCLFNQILRRDYDIYKAQSTPCDFAVQFGHTDVANLLKQHGAKTYLSKTINIKFDQSNHMALFIDFTTECVKASNKLASVNTVFSSALRSLINQKACPAVIIGQHLLRNALQLSCSLKDWVVIEITWKGVGGYVIIPKKLIKKSLDAQLQELGFCFFGVKNNVVNESEVIQKRSELPIDKDIFSVAVPPLLDKLLLPRERFIYWGGHGNVLPKVSMGCLVKDDAIKVLHVLANKKTKTVYVLSCFFGGKNAESFGDFNDMVIIAAATTEMSCSTKSGIEPLNWRGFFNALALGDQCVSHEKYWEYLACWALPFITTKKPYISNFPQVKFPGKPFKLVPINNQALSISQDNLLDNRVPIIIQNKRLLEVDVEFVKNTLEFKGEIPLIVSKFNKNVFEKVSIKNIEKLAKNDFIYFAQKLTRAPLFDGSTLENTLIIKELNLPANLLLDAKNNGQHLLPATIYNVVIRRGPSSNCSLFFSTSKNQTAMNSMCVAYDQKTKQWASYTSLSDDEFIYAKNAAIKSF